MNFKAFLLIFLIFISYVKLEDEIPGSEPLEPLRTLQETDSQETPEETPEETPSSETPSSETPSSETPSSETPSSETPSTDGSKAQNTTNNANNDDDDSSTSKFINFNGLIILFCLFL